VGRALLVTGFLLVAGRAPAQEAPAEQNPQIQLWDAAMRGDTSALGRALAQGALVDSLDVRRSPNGRRALNWAAWFNRPAAVRFLIAHGAAVNGANLTGFTALHHAAENGSLEAARALLEGGADPGAPNYLGQTPRDVARDRGHLDVAAVIDSSRT
jgi:E3 ubiquitin-protein ligase HECTD1